MRSPKSDATYSLVMPNTSTASAVRGVAQSANHQTQASAIPRFMGRCYTNEACLRKRRPPLDVQARMSAGTLELGDRPCYPHISRRFLLLLLALALRRVGVGHALLDEVLLGGTLELLVFGAELAGIHLFLGGDRGGGRVRQQE